MNINAPVWLFCERGTSVGLLAEPANLYSNIPFLFAGMAALWMYHKLASRQKSADHVLLIVLLLLTGLGSSVFHLFAVQGAELTHMFPLLVFMLVYMAFALNRFLEVPPGSTFVLVAIFAGVSIAGLTMTCVFADFLLQPAWSRGDGGATSCLNGAAGYIPSLVALVLLSFFLHRRGHRASSTNWLAAGLLLVSLAALGLDHLFCQQTLFRGHLVGTHFAWHILNALIMFLLVRSAMLHQNEPLVQEILPPDPKQAKNI